MPQLRVSFLSGCHTFPRIPLLFVKQIAEHQSCPEFSRILYSLLTFLIILGWLRVEIFVNLTREKSFETIMFIEM